MSPAKTGFSQRRFVKPGEGPRFGGVMPSHETIASGDYPFVNDFFVIIRADEPAGSPARQVMEWLLSPAGAQTVADAGYVPAA